jgi:hypothetical protein
MNRGLVSSLLIDEARRYVADKFGAFHQKRLDNLKKLKLSNILKKNFYLFAAKNILTAPDFIKIILDAHLSSQEKPCLETSLRDWLFISTRKFTEDANRPRRV